MALGRLAVATSYVLPGLPGERGYIRSSLFVVLYLEMYSTVQYRSYLGVLLVQRDVIYYQFTKLDWTTFSCR